jgi:hypothetical protein
VVDNKRQIFRRDQIFDTSNETAQLASFTLQHQSNSRYNGITFHTILVCANTILSGKAMYCGWREKKK